MFKLEPGPTPLVVSGAGSDLHRRDIVMFVTLDAELCGNVLFPNPPLLIADSEDSGLR